MKRESIEKYQEIFRKDPNSQVFAALAEAYREMGLFEQAEKVARHGVERHPGYVSGFVVLGRIYLGQERWKDAEITLQKAASLGPENILAHQLLGQVYLQTKRPKEALKAYKLVLYLNPQSEMARKAVEKLESLTADEFDDDVFEMKKLKEQPPGAEVPGTASFQTISYESRGQQGIGNSRERTLSLVDAYIVRNDIGKARDLLRASAADFPGDLEFADRWDMLAQEEEMEEATPLKPDLTREAFIHDRKIQRLHFLLQRIKEQQLSPKN